MRDLLQVTSKNTSEIRRFAARALSDEEISKEGMEEIFRLLDVINTTIPTLVKKNHQKKPVTEPSVPRRRRMPRKNIDAIDSK